MWESNFYDADWSFNFYDVDWENDGNGKFTEETANEIIVCLANLYLENIRTDNWVDFVIYNNAMYDLIGMDTILDPELHRHIVARINLCYSRFEDVLEPLEIDCPDVFDYEEGRFYWELIKERYDKEFENVSEEEIDRITEAVNCVYQELKNQIEFTTEILPKPEEGEW